MLAAEGVEEMEGLESRRRALETCLEKLSPPQRELLSAAYGPGARFNEVAAKVGKSAEAFYKTIQRLRTALLECVERYGDAGVTP
jgi:RNA polymerase sigma-70 factor (ECF subfamily)